MNNRRNLLAALGAAVLQVPLRSFAQQQGTIWRIGMIMPDRPSALESDPEYRILLQSLRELGYVDGKNLAIEWRFADGQYDQFPVFTAELVKLKVDVIVTGGPTATRAAQKVTTTVPIVMANSDDPVASGFVQSLAHPGGNITGLSNASNEIGPKQLELLLGIFPGLSSVAVLVNPANTSSTPIVLKSIQLAARQKNLSVLTANASTAQEIDAAFSTMGKDKVAAVIVVTDQTFIQQRSQIAALALKHRIPTIARDREYAGAGGLMNFGQAGNNMPRVAAFVDRILKGAKPGDLPIEQPTRFNLTINLKSAKAIGITIPQSVLLRADEVIQ